MVTASYRMSLWHHLYPRTVPVPRLRGWPGWGPMAVGAGSSAPAPRGRLVTGLARCR